MVANAVGAGAARSAAGTRPCIDTIGLMTRSAEELGRRLVHEMRTSVDERSACEDSATEQLLFDTEDLDDETLWSALLGALREVTGDREMWLLADGYVTTIVMCRDDLDTRLPDLCRTNPSAAEMARVMADPNRNAWGDDPLGNQSYWAALIPAEPTRSS